MTWSLIQRTAHETSGFCLWLCLYIFLCRPLFLSLFASLGVPTSSNCGMENNFRIQKHRDWISVWLQEMQRTIKLHKIECFDGEFRRVVLIFFLFFFGLFPVQNESATNMDWEDRKTELPKKWNCSFDNRMHSIIELYIYVITVVFSFPFNYYVCISALDFHIFSSDFSCVSHFGYLFIAFVSI